jgi:hypothetical protein
MKLEQRDVPVDGVTSPPPSSFPYMVFFFDIPKHFLVPFLVGKDRQRSVEKGSDFLKTCQSFAMATDRDEKRFSGPVLAQR